MWRVIFMIEITEAAANILKRSQVEGKVIRMFLAALDATGANYGLALGSPEKDDVVFEDRGVKIHVGREDAEILRETVIDYVNDEHGTGFIIRGPEDELSACGSCDHTDTCDHENDGSCDHDHDHDCGCGCS
jgi:iron-sulfur cluster assembly protein